MGWSNMLMMLAQSSTGFVETWFLAKLGTPVLAGVAVVVPVLMLMQNMSGGAMGGGYRRRLRVPWAPAIRRSSISSRATRWRSTR
jgi:hypothetical protein